MSYYGDGMVSSDFVGIAREQRTREEGLPHVYFTGCGGNIAAGKYNDGNKANRAILANRIYTAMVESERRPKRVPLGRVQWCTKPVLLEPDPAFSEQRMMSVVTNRTAAPSLRVAAALRLSFIRHCAAGVPIQFTSLLHLPAESFIEYQLFAQQQCPGVFVATASYGDCGPEYIPLEKSFAEGGYETTWAFAAPQSERQMKETIARLLKAAF
jgi:hypothetical protein